MTDTRIVASDLTCIVGAGERLYMQLLETGDNPCNGETVTFTIHGASYNRTTDVDGRANLQINLPVGSYQCTISFGGSSGLSPSSKTVTVTVTPKKMVSIVLNKLFIKTYGGNEALSAWVYESDGQTRIKGLKCTFTINGVTYNRTSNSDGEIKLAVNLRPGEYRCVVDALEDTTHQSAQENCTVRILSDTRMDGTNITKMEDETSVYQCAVYDFYGNRVQCNVDITVNGVTYTRHTDSNGLAKLNIRLGAGEYTITAKFNGDTMNNPSSVTNHISSKPYMVSLTTVKDGVSTPGENCGFMESKILLVQASAETSEQRKLKMVIHDWEGSIENGFYEMPFTSYEITETDPRVKTAKFTSNVYVDLTFGRSWIYISSPYHENFGGQILKVDYDKNTGLYTYQCQDGRRQYISKGNTLINDKYKVYDVIEGLIISPAIGTLSLPINDETRKQYASVLSGLKPIDSYNIPLSPVMKPINKLAEPCPEIIAYDSFINRIMALAHYGGTPTDVYFTPNGVCHVDPVDLNTWMKTGIKLTHSDLVHYKYGFDTTNILTSVGYKEGKGTVKWYDDGKDLQWIFGVNATLIDPVTTQQQTPGSTDSSSDTTSNTSTVSFDKCGVSKDKKQIMAIGKPSAVGERHYGYTLYKSVFKNYCPLCKREGVLTWGYMWSGNFPCVTKFRNGSAGRSEGHIYCGNCDADFSCIDGKNHVSSGRPLLTRISGPVKSSEAEASKLSSGGYSDTTSTSTVNTSGTTTTTTTVTDETATYNKALEELSKSVRDLLSFSIRVPLNSPIFKNLHTNMMLWTELPTEFKLGNLGKVFKLMASYKQSRGVSYVENRWYVEGVKTKLDSSGLFADITLNPFPSSYSTYSNAVKSYQEAYDQAFKQQEQTTTSSGTTSTGTGVGQPRLGNDGTNTGTMAAMRGAGYGHSGHGRNFDSAAKKGYAQQGRKYYNWARQYNSPTALAKALNSIYREASPIYSNHRYANAESTFNNGHPVGNCWDGARLVKCCFDACGFDCVVITGSIYGWGHGWNAIKYNGKWYTFDLLFDSRGSSTNGTNSIRAVW